MSATFHATDRPADIHEGAWAYLSLGGLEGDRRRLLVEACEASGWPAVSRSPAPDRDPERFFEGMSHAVQHADVVVVLMDGESRLTDAELALAFVHRRPVIGLSCAGGASESSAVRTMLRDYRRARVLDRDDLEACATGLREALADPDFTATINRSVAEADAFV